MRYAQFFSQQNQEKWNEKEAILKNKDERTSEKKRHFMPHQRLWMDQGKERAHVVICCCC